MVSGVRKAGRIDIASIRREQIVEAAVAVIADKGLQNLSLSEIESRVGMSRGQLTYYFKTKEAILLAVFDRLVQLMHQRQGEEKGNGVCPDPKTYQDVVHHVLERILEQPPAHPEFGCLQYTFLSQISHREDFRRRLSSLYEDWRSRMTRILAGQLGTSPESTKLRTLATLIQAIFHGIAMQVAADPAAVDRTQVIEMSLDLLETYMRKLKQSDRASTNGSTQSSLRKNRSALATKKVTAVSGRVARNGASS